MLALLGMATLASAMPTDLRCEGSVEPAGIDVSRPRLSWTLTVDDPEARGVRQVAYRVLVASSPHRLAADDGDLWDTGRVEADRLTAIEYTGKPIASGQTCYWKVRVWDNSGAEPADSRPSHWTAGLLQPGDWQGAKWIGSPELSETIGTGPRAVKDHVDSFLLRREFSAKPGLARAVLFVTGLGHYEASINGRKVGDQLIAPGWTEYEKTVLYDTFDVTEHVRAGAANAIGIILGNGMYDIQPTKGRYVKFLHASGPPKAIALLRLEYADDASEAVVSDRSWAVLPSPITYSNVFGGEDYDARLELTGWDEPGFTADAAVGNALEMVGPGGVLRGHSAAAPPIKAIETRRPISVTDMRPGVTIYDLGQNASFMPRFTVRGPAGCYVRAIPSELLGTDGYVDRASAVQDAGGPAWWQYTLAGTGGSERHFPKFFYQGCRYLQVERFPAEAGGELPVVEDIEGVIVHSSSEPIGTFETSNKLFNKTHALVRWAQRSNMMSLMTDCPHREKLGWLEELHLNGPSLRYNFRLDRLYVKEMNDMADAQLANGFVPNIAPEYFLAHTDKLTDAFRNSPEWGSAFVLVPWQQYLFTGDDSLVRRHYADMVRYFDFLASTAQDEILTVGLGDWYDLGPKPPWGSQLTPPPFTATAIYYYDACVLAEVAELLGKPDDAARFRAKAERIREAFNRSFFDANTKRYATGSQTTSAMPLVLDLVEPEHREAVLQALIDDIRARGNALSAGDVGYRFVLRALADAGRSDVIFEMNNQSERPGYGMQIARGATALTEKWDASVGSFGSQNHFMLGQINEWFFHDLAGIQYDPAAPGFDHVVIKPAPVGDLTHVRASYASVRGLIVSEWTNGPDGLTMIVTIPAGTTATIHVPTIDAGAVREGDGPAAAARGVSYLGTQAGAAVYEVGSGRYAFRSRIGPGRPTGLKAVTANGAVTLSWTSVANAEHYTVARRAGDDEPTVMSRELTRTTYIDDGLQNDQAYEYSVRAFNAVGGSMAATITATPSALVNASFDAPAVSGYAYGPTNAGWTFSPARGANGSGLAANNSAFTDKNGAAPTGTQVAFLQGTGTISQKVHGLAHGEAYTLTFRAAQRATYNKDGQTWRVEIDGTPAAEFAPPQSATAYAQCTARFTATADTHEIAFVGTNTHGGDNTILLDDVRLRAD